MRKQQLVKYGDALIAPKHSLKAQIEKRKEFVLLLVHRDFKNRDNLKNRKQAILSLILFYNEYFTN